MATNACTSCGAPLLWVISAKGHQVGTPSRMPLDAEPSVEGNVLVLWPRNSDPYGHVLTGDALQEARQGSPERVHNSHFATCPNAAKHRKRR